MRLHNRRTPMRHAKQRVFEAIVVLALAITFTSSAEAQVGKQQGLIDPNIASEADLLKLPHMNAAIAKALIERRPFLTMTDLDAFLTSQRLTRQQATEFY